MHHEDTLALDRTHLWHPYASVGAPAWPVLSTRGIYLELGDGRELIDGMSSWWAAIHGHGHPQLKQAAHDQIERMSHVMFGGLTHAPAAELAQRLARLSGLPRVFFSDSGSVAVEVAIKMALQYAQATGRSRAKALLTWRGGYHGDTFAAMSVCDPDTGMHRLWRGTLAEQVFAPAPPPRGSSAEVHAHYLREVDKLLRENSETIAAMIIEPIVQGAGGIRFHDPELLRGLRELTRRHQVLLIADEIATGFGRTGELFASHGSGILPDIMCVGKALSGGFMSLAATLCTEEIAQAIRLLMHGPTFMANPLACAVANASLKLLEQRPWPEEVSIIEQGLSHGLAPLAKNPQVEQVRVLGAIGVVEMRQPVNIARASEAAAAQGVWLRPFAKLIYTMPPYSTTPEQVGTICSAIAAAVEAGEAQP